MTNFTEHPTVFVCHTFAVIQHVTQVTFKHFGLVTDRQTDRQTDIAFQGLKCAGSHRVADPAHFDLPGGLYRVSRCLVYSYSA